MKKYISIQSTNSILFFLLPILFFSCQKDPISPIQDDCIETDKFLSYTIDGRKVVQDCTINPTGISGNGATLITGTGNIKKSVTNTVLDDFIILSVGSLSDTDLSGECVICKKDECENEEIYGEIVYAQQLNLVGDDIDDKEIESSFDSTEGEMKICFDKFSTKSGGQISGTFSGILFDDNDQKITIANGRFNVIIE